MPVSIRGESSPLVSEECSWQLERKKMEFRCCIHLFSGIVC